MNVVAQQTWRRMVRLVCFWIFVLQIAVAACAAQQSEHDMGMHAPSAQGGDMMMPSESVSYLPSPHASSGTGWQPASVPARIWMTSRSGWDLMAHGALFLTYNQQGGP